MISTIIAFQKQYSNRLPEALLGMEREGFCYACNCEVGGMRVPI